MSNQTTVSDVSIGGAVAMLVLWLLAYVHPDLVSSLPTGGEAGIALLISAGFGYLKEPKA